MGIAREREREREWREGKTIEFIHVYVCEALISTRPTCLHLESRYNISLFDSIHFNYP